MPNVVLETCSWEYMHAMLEVIRDLEKYREWKTEQERKEVEKPKGIGRAGMTLDATGFRNFFFGGK